MATVVVWRSGEDLSKPSSVDYVTSDGTAVAGEDYIPTSDTLTFAAGETTKSFAITLVKNSVSEGQEQFFVNFSNVKDAQMGLLTGTVTIYDPAPVTVDPTFDPGAGADGPVYDLFPVMNSQEQNSPATLKRSKGKILAMGDFSTIGGVSRKFLARLNDNGTTDPTFTAGGGAGDLDKAPFRLLELPGGLLLIAGEFTTVGGEAQSYLARLKADGSFDKTFRPIINGRG